MHVQFYVISTIHKTAMTMQIFFFQKTKLLLGECKLLFQSQSTFFLRQNVEVCEGQT